MWFFSMCGSRDFNFWLLMGTFFFKNIWIADTSDMITPWFQKMSVNKLCSKWRSQRDTSKSEMIDFLSYEIISSGILEVSSCHSSLTFAAMHFLNLKTETVSAYFYLIILNIYLIQSSTISLKLVSSHCKDWRGQKVENTVFPYPFLAPVRIGLRDIFLIFFSPL